MRLFLILIPIFSLSAVFSAFASDTDDVAGRVIANVAGTSYDLPMLDSKISVNIEGDMATVEVTQSFINEAHVPVEAEYLFPLNQLAAVYSMDMLIGDEVIKAKIREKAVAEAEFEKAAQDGKAAALLTQHRPNMFTQRIANLMPGLPITVTLRYVQMVPKIDGQHELVIPLIVGPRYESAAVQLPDEDSEDVPMTANSWSISDVPAYPQVVGLDLPDTFTSERVALDLALTGGVSISDFGSDTHQLAVQSTEEGLSAKFAKGKVLDNRDLVIRFTLGGETLEAASLSHTDERGGFVSLMIEPPAVPDDATITPRELVFVLDTSGSMGGQPMEASKRFMDAALRGMRPTDYFRIIPFANHTQNFSSVSKQATARNIRSARAYVDQLSTGGGTEIDNAIRTAFSTPQPENTMKIVVFLSDGYIGGEAQVLRTIRQQIGKSRIYAFGVGTSVNRYLLDAMADEGRGYARYVGVDEDAYEVAEMLAADLKSPLLTDISIDWGDLDVTDVTPSRLPDLFAGNSLRIYARHSGTGAAEVTLKGLVQGRQAAMPVKLTLTDNAENAALPLIWARNRIASLTRQIAVGEQPETADKEITKLGLEFSLQTQNTSFVAVSEQTVNTSGHQATLANVPLPMVSDVSKEAYPQPFAGSSSPEPQAIIGFLLIAAMTLLGFRRRVR
ncbi:Ca-activated chloride channel family protein [Litoreibacter ascidiaceicola]|uniref:Ca-activated chloride channel family protein n=1 Tax=Litoreibacter ascidiaceicola TaxID=1486859 RepID=A0A1M5CM98_9RHOB|nr:VIT and VWA domain-containing protein [Litoreibacter ascidiaceicola]SHF55884.1 Ca-activated chloride channel family protein [Litoreibacter ascidiaceicola]